MDISDDLSDLDLDSGLEEGLMVCSAVSISCAMLWYSSRFVKTPQHTSILSGQHWLDELLGGHDEHFHNEIRMQKFIFWRLLTTLETCAGLRGTQHVLAAEQVAIFLHFVRRGLSNRALQEWFQHSGDTIMKWVLCLITWALYWLSIQVYLLHPQCPDIRTNILWLCEAPHS